MFFWLLLAKAFEITVELVGIVANCDGDDGVGCHQRSPSDATLWCSHSLLSTALCAGASVFLRLVMSRGLGTYFLAASRLGEAGININYAYCGAEAGYCSAMRRRSFQHQPGTKTRRQLVNRTSSDCESSKYVGTGTPLAEKAN